AAHAGEGPQRHLARHRGPAQAHRGPHPLPPGARGRRAARHPGARPGAAGRPDRRAGGGCRDGRRPHRRPRRCAAMSAVPPPSAVDGVDVAAVHRWLDARRHQLVDDLVAYAELETPSDDLALLKKGLSHVEEWLTERLGPPASRGHHASDEYGDVVVLEHAGAGDRPLTLLAHYDTVWSAGTLD